MQLEALPRPSDLMAFSRERLLQREGEGGGPEGDAEEPCWGETNRRGHPLFTAGVAGLGASPRHLLYHGINDPDGLRRPWVPFSTSYKMRAWSR